MKAANTQNIIFNLQQKTATLIVGLTQCVVVDSHTQFLRHYKHGYKGWMVKPYEADTPVPISATLARQLGPYMRKKSHDDTYDYYHMPFEELF